MPTAPAPITEPTTTPPPVLEPGSDDGQAPAGPAPGESDQPEKPARPEWLGAAFDEYWSDDKGVDAERLEADFGSLKNLKAESEAKAKQVPENLDDYKVGLPEGFAMPEGLSAEVLENHPALGQAREFAKKHGLSTDGFKELVALQAKAEIADYDKLKQAANAERTKLGSNANARVNAVITKANAKLGPELANALLPMMFTAKQVEAVEKLLAEAGAPKMSTAGRETTQPTEISDADYEALSPTQRILRATQIQEQKRTKAS